MAQTGFTPIQIYYSTTPTNQPLAGDLAYGELAINAADGKLYYKDSVTNTVKLLASNSSTTNVTTFSAGTTGFTPSTATSGAVTLSGTLITTNGGTGLSSYTAGDIIYYATGTTLTKLAIGTNGQVLTSNGTAPTWSTPSANVASISFGTTGLTPATATTGAVTVAGTLATTNGGTGLTSFTSGGAVYATSTSALTTGTLPITSGGTGQITASAAFNALSPITTEGDLILGNGANSATRLAIGASSYILTSNGTTASWQPAPSSGVSAGKAIALAMIFGF